MRKLGTRPGMKTIRLKKRLEQLSAALLSIGDGLIITDAKQKISFINNKALEITGWSRIEALGQSADTVFRIINLKTKEPAENLVAKVLEKSFSTGLAKDSAIVTKQGEALYLSANISPLVHEGKVTGAVVVFRDIRRLRLAEEELVSAKEAAEIVSKAKSQFLANMSHEIRTPLNGMLGMIDLTMDTGLTAEQTENLVIAKGCAQNLLNVINDILDFSKIEAGRLEIACLPFNLKQAVIKTVKKHAAKAEAKGLTLKYSLPADLPDVVTGDGNRLEQVLTNLLGNAVKFTDQGEIALSLYQISANEDCYELKFAISDTGIGIAEEEKKCLFKSFSQVDGSLTRKYGGTGLGLAIAKQLVELMDGRIWVESQKDIGSTFYFTIKLQPGSAFFAEALEPLESSPDSQVRVLLAEDDKVSQKIIQHMLEQKGYRLEAVANGREVLVRLSRESFDLVLMNIELPEMNGVETARRIRLKERRSKEHIPIIAVAARPLIGEYERFLEAGMDDYLAKPIIQCELYRAIDKVLEKSSVARIMRDLIAKADLSKEGPRPALEDTAILDNICFNFAGLQKAYAKNDFLLIEQIAHTIKETADDVGEERIKRLSFRIELAARKKGNVQIAGLLLELSAEVNYLKNKGELLCGF